VIVDQRTIIVKKPPNLKRRSLDRTVTENSDSGGWNVTALECSAGRLN
jgi:hypothetical protein